jgi:hypothetical protein
LRPLEWLLSSYSLTDNPHIFQDAPVGLQLVGRTHEEEAVLAMTEIVDNALKATQKGSTDCSSEDYQRMESLGL